MKRAPEANCSGPVWPGLSNHRSVMTLVCSDKTLGNIVRFWPAALKLLHIYTKWTRYFSSVFFEKPLEEMFKPKLNTRSWGREFLKSGGSWNILKYRWWRTNCPFFDYSQLKFISSIKRHYARFQHSGLDKQIQVQFQSLPLL